MFGSKTKDKTYQPYVTIDDVDVQVRSITRRGNDYYMKVGKRGSIFGQERFIGTATGKGPKQGIVFGTTYRVEWERD